MKIETVMNAMMFARDRGYGVYGDKRTRQYHRFRKWLIVRDCRLERQISNLKIENEMLREKLLNLEA